jgi:hypothetical protein
MHFPLSLERSALPFSVILPRPRRVRSWWESLLGVSSDFSAEIDEVRDLGDVTVARLRLRGHGMGSDAPMEQTQWHVTEWRNGKSIWARISRSEAEAPRGRRAAGEGERLFDTVRL